MQKKPTINYGNFLLSLSDSVDLASPHIALHQQRTAYLSMEMCKIANLSEDLTNNIFIAALFHDVGAITVEEKISLHAFETDNIDRHCLRGELLLKRIPRFEIVAEFVKFHHTRWDEFDESIDSEFVTGAQIIQLADYVERLIDRDNYILNQTENILDNIKKLSGNVIHPEIINHFLAISNREELWLDLISSRLYSILFSTGPLKSFEIEISEIEIISKLFKDLIDYKSPFTATHTSGVSASAKILSELFGLTESEIKHMGVAGNLHDLGKLIIPNSILDKPGGLTKPEFNIIKSHTYYSYQIISSIKGLENIAEWAAYHHEKLNGSGYPFKCNSSQLTIGARIMMVADIFTALSEDRPYRKGMEKNEIYKIFQDLVSTNTLDERIVNLLFDHYEKINSQVSQIQSAAKDFYQTRFSLLE